MQGSMQQVQLPNLYPGETIEGYYTGKNINATNGSRTAISAFPLSGTKLTAGCCVILDPYQFDTGPINVTQPQTNFDNLPTFIVTRVPKDSNTGGNISMSARFYGSAWTKANQTIGQTLLGAANGQFMLGAKTSIASLAALFDVKGIALSTVDTSGTEAMAPVAFGFGFG